MSGAMLLDVQGLSIHHNGGLRLVESVSFSVERGESVAIVGESGCGKSLTALSLIGLLPPGLNASGRILLEGEDINTLSPEALRQRRGSRVAMVFQDSLSALNPVIRIGDQIVEALMLDRTMTRAAARARAVELLAMVRISDPSQRVDAYPHQLSGGMRQRVVIALALSRNPRLLIADEPTTALDVTVQAQVLDLLKEIQVKSGLGLILITHDLGVVRRVASRVVIMYAGSVAEEGNVSAILRNPGHPYTRGLLAARPHGSHMNGQRLAEIAGTVPAPARRPVGCVFAPRCDLRQDDCTSARPMHRTLSPGHALSCFHPIGLDS